MTDNKHIFHFEKVRTYVGLMIICLYFISKVFRGIFFLFDSRTNSLNFDYQLEKKTKSIKAKLFNSTKHASHLYEK